ncbi:MAG: dUTP diphosphatase [Oscillospiraceae bacterium]|nr:dUTP diphosphatase [Oscillospiraceae bacterium]
MNKIKIKKLNNLAQIPKKATPGSAGYDLCAAIKEDLQISAGAIAKVPTGLCLELPNAEFVALVFARSGLSVKVGVSLANGVGVIDSDYRGEVVVALRNYLATDYFVVPGERIAQMVIVPIVSFMLEEVDELADTQRGGGGFGSTGTK